VVLHPRLEEVVAAVACLQPSVEEVVVVVNLHSLVVVVAVAVVVAVWPQPSLEAVAAYLEEVVERLEGVVDGKASMNWKGRQAVTVHWFVLAGN